MLLSPVPPPMTTMFEPTLSWDFFMRKWAILPLCSGIKVSTRKLYSCLEPRARKITPVKNNINSMTSFGEYSAIERLKRLMACFPI